jgi:hypothetical protein
MSTPEPNPRIARWEWAAALLLVLAALVPRVRDLRAGFDRSFEGFQGAFFAMAALNYERAGVGAFGGYPLVNLELDRERPATWYTYENHPPTVPLLAWASVRAAAPRDPRGELWSESWRSARAPYGIEPALRAPFLALHLLGLAALWWCVRQGARASEALLALAIAAALPISAVYGTLVNYENPSLVFVLLGTGCCLRWLRAMRGRALAGCALWFAAAGAVTYAPAFFALALGLWALARAGLRRGGAVFVAALGGALAPLLAHAWLAHEALASIGRSSMPLARRALLLWGPMFERESAPWHWLGLQIERCAEHFTLPILLAATLGALLLAARSLARRRTQRARAAMPHAHRSAAEVAEYSAAVPLACGGLLVLLGFYRHTFDPQTPFLLNLAPGAAALAAVALERARTALGPRAARSAAPAVALAGLLVLPGLLRTDELRARWRAPGPLDEPAGARGPEQALPRTEGARIAELIEPGAVGLYPEAAGLTVATSFYAWRTLLPLPQRAWSAALGLARAPHYVLVPLQGEAARAPQVRALAAELRAGSPPVRENAHWAAWPAPP